MRAARMSKRQASPATSAVVDASAAAAGREGQRHAAGGAAAQRERAAGQVHGFAEHHFRSAAAGKVLLPCAGVVVDTDGGVFGLACHRR